MFQIKNREGRLEENVKIKSVRVFFFKYYCLEDLGSGEEGGGRQPCPWVMMMGMVEGNDGGGRDDMVS